MIDQGLGRFEARRTMVADLSGRLPAGTRPISPQDAWIAATALRYQIPLVTHNAADFDAVEGLTIITELV